MAEQNSLQIDNFAIRSITSILGVSLALGGFAHGWFERLQGNTPTGNAFIESIAPPYLQWAGGNDPAFTLIPNFYWTGIASMTVSALIIIWSVFFVGRRHGASVFLALFILLTLVGGGIGHIPFFIASWAYASRMHKPLTGWQRIWPEHRRARAGRAWPILTALASLGFVLGMVISVFGLPGISEDGTVFAVCWGFLGFSLICIQLAYATGAAYDLAGRTTA